jgi:hypothetical protein
MADNAIEDTPSETQEPTKEQLLSEMEAAMAAEVVDWKLVSSVSGKIAKLAAAEEKAERDALVQMLAAVEADVKAIIEDALEDFNFPEQADGVWFAWDFGEGVTSCRLLKGTVAAKVKTPGSGSGKKYKISTAELVALHGDIVKEGTGETFRALYEGNTNGNYRYYQIRVPLLKASGYTE